MSGNDKLFRLDLNPDRTPGKKTQLTFGTHDDGAAQFLGPDTLVFPSTAVDPNQPINPEVARNGNIYNIWTLNLKNGELKQYTDALGGNVSPIPLQDENKQQKVAFVTYYKGEYGIHTLPAEGSAPHGGQRRTSAARDRSSTSSRPLSHTLVKQNERDKGKFEKLFLEGRPPVNVGVTSSGDFFGGTAVTFTDVLGDQQFNLYAESVSQYRSLSLSYTNLSRRFQYALQGFSLTQFYYGNYGGYLYDPIIFLSRERGAGDADRARRHGLRDLSDQPLRATRAERRHLSVQAGVQRRGAAVLRRSVPAAALRPVALRQRHDHAVGRCLRPRDDRVPRVRAALGRHDARRIRDRATGRRVPLTSDRRRGRPQVHPARHQRRARLPVPRVQQLGRLSELPVLRRQLRAARATTIWSSSARRRSSPTPSCGSR